VTRFDSSPRKTEIYPPAEKRGYEEKRGGEQGTTFPTRTITEKVDNAHPERRRFGRMEKGRGHVRENIAFAKADKNLKKVGIASAGGLATCTPPEKGKQRPALELNHSGRGEKKTPSRKEGEAEGIKKRKGTGS